MSGDNRKHYVVGFLFRFARTGVALITKNRPEWQRGKLNGIGGGVEEGETALDAMKREFREETGLIVPDWHHFAAINFRGALVDFFMAEVEDAYLSQTTDERVAWYRVADIPHLPTIPNLRWLIPLAISPSREVAWVEDPS